ncbi:MAG: hypothetical protein ACOCYD_00630 [bacterium]
MEDVLYIILAIVWLIISIIGGQKKKKQAQSQPQPNRSEPQPVESEPSSDKKESDFEDLLEEFFGTDEPRAKKQPDSQPEVQKTSRPTYTEEHSYDEATDSDYRFGSEQKADEVEKFKGAQAIEEDFEFSAEGKVETLEDLIKLHEEKEQKILEEDSKINVMDLDEEAVPVADLEFDPRKAVIYSEIINRKYS